MGIVSLELNELSPQCIRRHVSDGRFPTFGNPIAAGQLAETDAGDAGFNRRGAA